MISVSSIEFDVDGAIIFEEDIQNTNYGKLSRRGNRIATLDGSAIMQDRGFSISDLKFKITVRTYSKIAFSRLKTLLEQSSLQRISTKEGVFIGRLKNISEENNRFGFEVLERD